MSKANTRFTRRALVAGFASVPIATKATNTKQLLSSDADLVRFGRQFHELTSTLDDLARTANHTYKDIVTLVEAIEPIEAAIVGTPAKTIEGLLVKARAANWEREGYFNPEQEPSTAQKLAWSIVRGLISLSHPQLTGFSDQADTGEPDPFYNLF